MANFNSLEEAREFFYKDKFAVNTGITLDSILYTKNSGNYNVLEVTLDKVGGLDLEGVVNATNIINPIVDEYDFTNDSYILDVMSKERGEKNE